MAIVQKGIGMAEKRPMRLYPHNVWIKNEKLLKGINLQVVNPNYAYALTSKEYEFVRRSLSKGGFIFDNVLSLVERDIEDTEKVCYSEMVTQILLARSFHIAAVKKLINNGRAKIHKTFASQFESITLSAIFEGDVNVAPEVEDALENLAVQSEDLCNKIYKESKSVINTFAIHVESIEALKPTEEVVEGPGMDEETVRRWARANGFSLNRI